jgi:hypothetical protein
VEDEWENTKRKVRKYDKEEEEEEEKKKKKKKKTLLQ